MIHAFISTCLGYSNALCADMNWVSISHPQVVQNTAAHLLTGTRRRDHVTPALASFHWLPVCFRKILLFTFQSVNGLVPQYITSLLDVYSPSRFLRSADQLRLAVPKKPAWKVEATAKYGIELPSNDNSVPNLRTFKSSLIFTPCLIIHLKNCVVSWTEFLILFRCLYVIYCVFNMFLFVLSTVQLLTLFLGKCAIYK